jgi:ribosomal protein S18 acetylase RimI-like enzyme
LLPVHLERIAPVGRVKVHRLRSPALLENHLQQEDDNLMEQTSAEPMSIALRPVQPDDDPFLFEVYVSTRAEELAAWGWDAAQQEAFLRMQFNVQRQAYGGQYGEFDYSVILFNDQRVGRIMVSRTEQEILFIDIALLPPFRNRGIGTSLIKDLCAESTRRNVPVRLHHLKSNVRAARLYRRMGFNVTDEDDIYAEMEWHPAAPGQT